MGNGAIHKAIQKIAAGFSKNSPTILTGVSVAGLIATTVLAVKATPKALRLIKDEQNRREDTCMVSQTVEPDPLTKMETVKLTWQCYLPAAGVAAVTIACIIGSNSINLRRNVALASVYSITEAALKEYQAKVIETVGENKAKKISDDIAKDAIEKNPVSSKEVIITGKGEALVYDTLSGRYFKSDIDKIRRVQNEFNRRLMDEMFITLNELYYELGLSSIKLGDDIGWDVDQGMVEFNFSSQLNRQKILSLS
jgi:hypothetical protein